MKKKVWGQYCTKIILNVNKLVPQKVAEHQTDSTTTLHLRAKTSPPWATESAHCLLGRAAGSDIPNAA